MEHGQTLTPSGIRIYYRWYSARASRATVVFSLGFGDHCARYHSQLRSLADQHISCLVFDYRGFGQSEGRRGHVGSYRDYREDLECALSIAREKSLNNRRPFVVGHSMGVTILLSWLVDQYSQMDLHGMPDWQPFEGALLVAPYLGRNPKLKPPKLYAKSIVWLLERTPWLLPWVPSLAWPTAGNGVSPKHLTDKLDILDGLGSDPFIIRETTIGWFKATLQCQRQLRNMIDDLSIRKRLCTLPTTLLYSNSDPVVDGEEIRRTLVEKCCGNNTAWNVDPDDSLRFHDLLHRYDKEFERRLVQMASTKEPSEHRVFIACKGTEVQVAARLKSLLEEVPKQASSRPPVVTHMGDFGGGQWRKHVRHEIEQADTIIVLATNPLASFDWQMFETGLFLGHRKRTDDSVYVLTLGGVPPSPIEEYQAFSIVNAEHIKTIIATITGVPLDEIDDKRVHDFVDRTPPAVLAPSEHVQSILDAIPFPVAAFGRVSGELKDVERLLINEAYKKVLPVSLTITNQDSPRRLLNLTAYSLLQIPKDGQFLESSEHWTTTLQQSFVLSSTSESRVSPLMYVWRHPEDELGYLSPYVGSAGDMKVLSIRFWPLERSGKCGEFVGIKELANRALADRVLSATDETSDPMLNEVRLRRNPSEIQGLPECPKGDHDYLELLQNRFKSLAEDGEEKTRTQARQLQRVWTELVESLPSDPG